MKPKRLILLIACAGMSGVVLFAQPAKHDGSKPRAEVLSRVQFPPEMGAPGTVVRGSGPGTDSYLVEEDFEETLFPPAGWTVINPDTGITWARSTLASGYGAGDACARIHFWNYIPGAGQLDSLKTPVLLGLAAVDSLVFDYAYCRYPTPPFGPDTVEVYLSTDGGSTFPTLLTLVTEADSTAPSTTSNWEPDPTEWGTRRISLPSGVAGASVQILFLGRNHYGQNFYLDNVRVGTPPTADISAFALDYPFDGGFLAESTLFSPVATFKNLGTDNQTSPFDVRYEILDTSLSVIYANTQSIAALASGSTQQVNFNTLPNGLTAGAYTIRAFSLLPSDQNPSNDTLNGTITVDPIVTSFPYLQDFEGAADENWTTVKVSGNRNDWVRGTPSKVTQIYGAHSGLKAWVTGLDSIYANSQNAALVSPLFDFGAITSGHILEFWQNFKIEADWDAGVLEYSTDFGVTWFRMDSTLGTGPNFDTPDSRKWYNDSSDRGPLVPPKWSATSTAYSGNDAGWIRSTTSLDHLAGLAHVKFRWRFRSDASDGDEGWAIDDVTIQVDSLRTVAVSIHEGWNMISNPVTLAPGLDSVRQIFPNALSECAYRYVIGSGYQQQCPGLPNGPGFWLKFPGPETNYITGSPRTRDSISVGAGWNLVGSIAYDVVASTISSVPPGIITSPWYGFESGYVPVGFVKPGKGHWVKISEAGTIVLSVSGAERPASDPLGMLAGLNSLTLADSRGGRQTLYFGDRQHTQLSANFFELPPIGPDGFFDARFESQRLVETFNEATGASAEFPISIRSVEYPLSVSWDIKPGSSTRFVLRYGVSDGIIVQRTVMSGLGQLSIANQSVNRLIVAVEADNIPQQFLLLQNYPNPFNPSTQITFALPVRANVVLKIYDVLGREIRTLASGSRAAGYCDVTWDGRNGDGSHVGSGVYFFRLVALGEAGTTVFQDTRKLMLLR